MRLKGSSHQVCHPLGSTVMPEGLPCLRRRLSMAQSMGSGQIPLSKTTLFRLRGVLAIRFLGPESLSIVDGKAAGDCEK